MKFRRYIPNLAQMIAFLLLFLIGCKASTNKPDSLLLSKATNIRKIESSTRFGYEFDYDYPDSAEGIILHYDSLYTNNGYEILTRFYDNNSFMPRTENGKDILWFAREWISNNKKNVAFLEIKQFQNTSVVSIVSQKYPYIKAPNEK